MAFETSTSSTSSAQSTSSFGNGGDDPNANSDNTAFSPGSSPPLILAFLAIGLFSAAMIAVFGWRRVNFGRQGGFAGTGFVDEGRARSGRRRGIDELGDPPKLWDLWSDKGQGREMDGYEDLKEVRWEDVMPISVLPLREDIVPQPTTAKPCHDTTTSTNTNPPPLTLRRQIEHLYHSLRRDETPVMDDANEKNEQAPPTPPPPPATSLQIAVAIAMPTPKKGKRKSVLSEQSTVGGDEDDESLEYSIGLCRVPWNAEEG